MRSQGLPAPEEAHVVLYRGSPSKCATLWMAFVFRGVGGFSRVQKCHGQKYVRY